MEQEQQQQQRFLEDRHFGEAVIDQYANPVLLGLPHIKVETDQGVYQCQNNQYSGSNSSSFPTEFSPSSMGCDSSCIKDGQPQPDSDNNYCNRTVPQNSIHLDTSYNLQSGVASTMRSSTSALNHSSCPDRVNATPRYLTSDASEDHSPVSPSKSRSHIVSPWSILPRPNERLQPYIPPHSIRQQFYRTSDENVDKSVNTLKNGESDDCESRQAFDLTCHARSSAKEERSINNSHLKVSEEPSPGNQVQSSSQPRCMTKPQTCKVCGKVLSSPSSYYVHMKLHSGNKPYACTVCDASFCRKPYLEVHMRTHTGERPFECDMCYKRFTQKSSLNTHKRVHTGERPYSCDICQKTFAVKSYVTAHRWSHVSEKPLECQHCGMTFTSKNLFSLHIRTHVDQNHECQVCGRTFMKDSYLIRHQNRVHRDLNASYSDTNEPRSPSVSPPDTNSKCSSVTSESSSTHMNSPLARTNSNSYIK